MLACRFGRFVSRVHGHVCERATSWEVQSGLKGEESDAAGRARLCPSPSTGAQKFVLKPKFGSILRRTGGFSVRENLGWCAQLKCTNLLCADSARPCVLACRFGRFVSTWFRFVSRARGHVCERATSWEVQSGLKGEESDAARRARLCPSPSTGAQSLSSSRNSIDFEENRRGFGQGKFKDGRAQLKCTNLLCEDSARPCVLACRFGRFGSTWFLSVRQR